MKALLLLEFETFIKKKQFCTDPQKLDQESNEWRSVFL